MLTESVSRSRGKQLSKFGLPELTARPRVLTPNAGARKRKALLRRRFWDRPCVSSLIRRGNLVRRMSKLRQSSFLAE